jgi:hypothetical protein
MIPLSELTDQKCAWNKLAMGAGKPPADLSWETKLCWIVGHFHPGDIMESENGRGYKLRPQTTFIYNRSSPMNVGECRPDAVRTEMEGSDFLIEGTLEKDDL